jgi:hypothetical protein
MDAENLMGSLKNGQVPVIPAESIYWFACLCRMPSLERLMGSLKKGQVPVIPA